MNKISFFANKNNLILFFHIHLGNTVSIMLSVTAFVLSVIFILPIILIIYYLTTEETVISITIYLTLPI